MICVLLCSVTPVALHAMHYYTLDGGPYSSSTSIWSTDGLNPCFCSPDDTLGSIAADTLSIRHDILLDADLYLLGLGYLEIQAGAQVMGPYGLYMQGGILRNQGFLQVSTLDITDMGIVYNEGTLNVQSGGLQLRMGNLQVMGVLYVGGNLETYMDGFLHVFPGGRIMVDGDYTNGGVTFLETGACVQALGTVTNTSVFAGDGFIGSQRDVTNMGDWAFEIEWCAAGMGIALPSLPDCIGCGPLPVVLAHFEAHTLTQAATVALCWKTSLEVNSDAFLVARSQDGLHFQTIAEHPAKAMNGKGADYILYDAQAPEGDLWYQLTERDAEGTLRVLGIQRVRVEPTSSIQLHAWPSPFAQTLNFQLPATSPSPYTLQLIDLQGRSLWQAENQSSGTIYAAELPTGMYILEYRSGSQYIAQRICRQ